MLFEPLGGIWLLGGGKKAKKKEKVLCAL